MAKLEKGSTVKITATVSRVWDNGLITVHIAGYEHPVTLQEKYLDEVAKPAKQAKARVRKPVWPRHDEPD